MKTSDGTRLAYLALGALVGGALGYLTGDWLAWKYQEIGYQKDLDELNRLDQERGDLGFAVSQMKPDGPVVVGMRIPEAQKKELEELAKQYESDNAWEAIPEEVEILDEPEDVPDIEIISFDEWADAPSARKFQKVYVVYYTVEGVFARDGEVEITNHEDVLGDSPQHHFGKSDGGDKNTVYIRNHRMSVDYQIERVEASYDAFMGGMEDPEEPEEKPPEPPKRIRRAVDPKKLDKKKSDKE